MKFRPLHRSCRVKRIEEEQKTKGGIIIPDTAKEKPMQGEVLAVGPGARNDKGEPGPDGRPGRRPGAVRQVVRHRGQARRRGAPDHEGKRTSWACSRRAPPRPRPPDPPRHDRPSGDSTDGCQGSQVLDRRPDQDAQGRPDPQRRGQGHARPQGPQRRARQELRRAADHQGRRDRRQGDRALRQVREHGRADGARGRHQDQRRRRRRHHHRHHPRRGDRPRGRQGGRRRR